MPQAAPQPEIDSLVDGPTLARVIAAHPHALSAPRQRARFLCGITSPATTGTRLTRESLFGALADRRFAEVLGWRETLDAAQQ